jgi:hypothetical protein
LYTISDVGSDKRKTPIIISKPPTAINKTAIDRHNRRKRFIFANCDVLSGIMS